MKGVWKFVGGCVVGAASAIVMSPKSGSTLRREMALRIAHGLERAAGEPQSEPQTPSDAGRPAQSQHPVSGPALPRQKATASLEVPRVQPEAAQQTPLETPEPASPRLSRLAAEAAVLSSLAQAAEDQPEEGAPAAEPAVHTDAGHEAPAGSGAAPAMPASPPQESYSRYGTPVSAPEEPTTASPPHGPSVAPPIPVVPSSSATEERLSPSGADFAEPDSAEPGGAAATPQPAAGPAATPTVEATPPPTTDEPAARQAPSVPEGVEESRAEPVSDAAVDAAAVTDEALDDLRSRIEETRAAVREALDRPFATEGQAAEEPSVERAAASGAVVGEDAAGLREEHAADDLSLDDRVAELRSLAGGPAAQAFSDEPAWATPESAEAEQDRAEPAAPEESPTTVAEPQPTPEESAPAGEPAASEPPQQEPAAAGDAEAVESEESTEVEGIETLPEVVEPAPEPSPDREAGMWVVPEMAAEPTPAAADEPQDVSDLAIPPLADRPQDAEEEAEEESAVAPAAQQEPSPESPAMESPAETPALRHEPTEAEEQVEPAAPPVTVDASPVVAETAEPTPAVEDTETAEPTRAVAETAALGAEGDEASPELPDDGASVDQAVVEAFDLDRSGSPAAGAPVDQAEMRRRIEETRNRLKAKAFDAMASGEAVLLSREPNEPEPVESAPTSEAPLDDDVQAVIDRSLSQDDY